MLKTRVLTALIIAAIGLAALFLAPPPVFALVAAGVLLGLGGREAARLAGFPAPGHWLLFVGLLLALACAWYLLAPAGLSLPMLVAAAGLWLGLFLWLSQAQAGRRRRIVKLLILSVILLAAWLAMTLLQAASPWLVLMLILIIAAADVGAFFTGRAIGGPKLAPSISPGKTWSGAVGGISAAVALAIILAFWLPQAPFSPALAAAMAAVLALVSIGGDLFMSLLKRQQGLKDTSSLLPGHGGVLDRFDSLGAALPFFAIAWLWWGQ